MMELIPVLKCERQFVQLEDLLQVVGIGRQYFCVRCEAAGERVVGSVWIKSGLVVGADCGDLEGRAALFAVLAETSVTTFSVFRAQKEPATFPAPLGSISELMLEAAEPARAEGPVDTAAGLRLAPEAPPSSSSGPERSTDTVGMAVAAEPPLAYFNRTASKPAQGRIVAFASAKGGVGKTTLALNVALAFAEMGQSVRLVDTDPLGGVAHSLAGAEARGAAGVYDVLLGRKGVHEVVLPTRVPTLEIVPAGRLGSQEALQNLKVLTEPAGWAALLSALSGESRLVLVDLPAGLFGVPHAVLQACTHIFAILEAEPLALRILPQLLQGLEEVGGSATLAGIILNAVQFRTSASLGVVQGAWASFARGLVLETTVPRDKAFLEASEAGVPVAFLDRAKRPPVAAVFRHLADDIAERIGLYDVKAVGEPRRLL